MTVYVVVRDEHMQIWKYQKVIGTASSSRVKAASQIETD